MFTGFLEYINQCFVSNLGYWWWASLQTSFELLFSLCSDLWNCWFSSLSFLLLMLTSTHRPFPVCILKCHATFDFWLFAFWPQTWIWSSLSNHVLSLRSVLCLESICRPGLWDFECVFFRSFPVLMEGDLKPLIACPVSRLSQGQCTLTNYHIHIFPLKMGHTFLGFLFVLFCFALLIIFLLNSTCFK